jgi:ATP-dependent Clp protease ATP-binding subunit ClpA
MSFGIARFQPKAFHWMMTERSIRMPFIKSRDPFVMVPGGASIPWPPQDDQYTEQAKRALAFAQDEAARLNHNHIGAVHILVGAARVEHGLPKRVFADLGVTIDRLLDALTSTMGRSESPIDASDITLTPYGKNMMERAVHESRRLVHPAAGPEHLVLAVVREPEHFSTQLLASLELNAAEVRGRILAHMRVPPSYGTAENATPTDGPYDRFDDATKRMLTFALEEAAALGQNWVGCEHLLLGLARSVELAPSDNATRRLFTELGLTLDAFRASLDALRANLSEKQLARRAAAPPSDVKFTGVTKLVIELAIDEAGPESTILSEHILLAIGRAQGSTARYLLSQLGATPERTRSVITKHRSV